jgi:hypothetical protein
MRDNVFIFGKYRNQNGASALLSPIGTDTCFRLSRRNQSAWCPWFWNSIPNWAEVDHEAIPQTSRATTRISGFPPSQRTYIDQLWPWACRRSTAIQCLEARDHPFVSPEGTMPKFPMATIWPTWYLIEVISKDSPSILEPRQNWESLIVPWIDNILPMRSADSQKISDPAWSPDSNL